MTSDLASRCLSSSITLPYKEGCFKNWKVLEALNVKALCKSLLLFFHLFRLWWCWIYPNSIMETVDPHLEDLFSGTARCSSYGNGILTVSPVTADLNGNRITNIIQWQWMVQVIRSYLFVFYIMSSHFCPVHFSLFEKLNLSKDWPQATELVHYCTALVLMSEDGQGKLGIKFRPNFPLMYYNCHGTSKNNSISDKPISWPIKCCWFQREHTMLDIFSSASQHSSQSDHDWRYEELPPPVNPEIWPYCHLEWLSPTLTMLSHEMVLWKIDQARSTLPEFERWQRGLPFAPLVCGTSEIMPHLGPLCWGAALPWRPKASGRADRRASDLSSSPKAACASLLEQFLNQDWAFPNQWNLPAVLFHSHKPFLTSHLPWIGISLARGQSG